MDGSTMVVLIVLVSVGFGTLYDMYNKHLKHKEKELQAGKSNQNSGALEAKIAQMEERIRVLEAIITDEGYQLSQKISALESQSKAS
ncbi:hypothetical protein [Gallaecimonas pentaromativorans]|uniref:Phage shock protein B n=1 Tax=Gallaecimonas pentaromativorans TaxID=584787 RepID=A0A3N1P4S4_9GAMM|nr:hypothetical protein [Gallaecimonas pentaromativorans]MED5524047.1 hypothetical protein [Pseudomonadota bacterium]ROQ22471.1 hypothetical protein EDC28_110115 [Gallaecimonas pentaromativorans]